MIKMYERVVLNQSIPARKLMKGDIGTVVMIHNKGKGFEVEFFTLEGSTRFVETLSPNQIRMVKSNEVAHVREIA